MTLTRKFGKIEYTFHKEYDEPMEAYKEWKRLKRLNPPMLARVTPTRFEQLAPGTKTIVWTAKDTRK